MSVQTLYDTGVDYEITSQFDGAVYNTAVGEDCVCQGIGNEFAITTSSTNTSITFSEGSQAVIGGGFFRVTAVTQVDLSDFTNKTAYVCARIDTSKAAGQTGSFVVFDNVNNIMKENLNSGGQKIRDMLLYTITLNGSGVTATVDNRKIIGSGVRVDGLSFKAMTISAYSGLTSEEPNTIYFLHN